MVTSVNDPLQVLALRQGVEKLLLKQAIRLVEHTSQEGFYSRYFLVPDLRHLNRMGKKQRQRRKQQLPTPSSAATPPTPPSPPSQEIWEWLVHPEADLFHDLPTALSTLWHRDGERWEEWEREHHPGSLQEIAVMVLAYLAIDEGEIPLLEEKGVEPLPSPREGEPFFFEQLTM
ncbi:UNVERIFIED_CONTAM: hypothetical protein FKN15_052052 [Acipenser sinensis]